MTTLTPSHYCVARVTGGNSSRNHEARHPPLAKVRHTLRIYLCKALAGHDAARGPILIEHGSCPCAIWSASAERLITVKHRTSGTRTIAQIDGISMRMIKLYYGHPNRAHAKTAPATQTL